MTEDMENIETTNDELEKFRQKNEVTWLQEIKTTIIFIVGLAVLCGALFGALFSTRLLIKDVGTIQRFMRLYDRVVSKKNLKENLKTLTETPHYSGTKEGEQVGKKIKEMLTAYLGKKDVVSVYNETYDVLLPFPDGVSTLTYTDGSVTETATLTEPEVPVPASATTASKKEKKKENKPGYSFWNKSWLAYSAAGAASGKMIYVNYGTHEDFKHVVDRGIKLEGTIAIIRYGKIFRGNKVKLAEQHKCAGVILYSDPADDGKDVGKVYPDGLWRPETSFQRGSSMYLAEQPGDPTTPGFPSIPGTRHRIERKDATSVPKIPILAISAKDAQNFMKHLDGEVVADKDWKGGLGDVYKYGTLANPFTVNMDVKIRESITPIYNVFAKIEGKVEPDRLVMVGNHRDPWVYGAVDPHSGTMVLLEVAKALGQLLHNGWQPRRSIVFAFWDAEEPGLIGSTEFVEQYRENLRNQMVSYINVDSYSGDVFKVVGSAALSPIIREACEHIPYGNGTILDSWRKRTGVENPLPELVGSGSDYTAFYHHVGIPILDLAFKQSNGKTYGGYHSVIDNFDYFSKYIDKDFLTAEALTKITGRVLLQLADDVVLNFGIEEQAVAIEKEVVALTNVTGFSGLYSTLTPSQQSDVDLSLAILKRAANAYKEAGEVVSKTLDALRRLDEQSLNYETKVRTFNDRVTFAERGFVSAGGLPGRTWYKHVISAPGKDLGYGFEVFPAVKEALRAPEQNRKQLLVNALSDLAESIESATSFVTGTFTNRNVVKE